MIARKTDHVPGKAEGRCLGVPYNTELASINGVSIHFWIGPDGDCSTERLAVLVACARSHRDIVRAQYSMTNPDGFWASADMPGRHE